jgi:hypothetical protein
MSFVPKRRPLSRAGLAAVAVSAVLGGGLVCLAGPASAATISDVVISEVESNGDVTHGDWIELHNEGDGPVDISGAILSDNKNADAFVIPAGTTLAADGYAAFTVDSDANGFGLGAPDSARLFAAGADVTSDDPIDEFDWDTHAATTYGRNPLDGDVWETTAASTFGAANVFDTTVTDISPVKINEVVSTGDAVNGDWIELYNTSASAINIGGAILSDSEDQHQLLIPSGTVIAGHGYYAIRVDDPANPNEFGLGGSDSARLFAPGDTTLSTPVDSFTWTSAAPTSWGRDVPGTGSWVQTLASTFDAPNNVGTGSVPNIADVQISEVRTTGDDVHGDWIELHNTGPAPADLSGAILSDNDDSHTFVIPANTTLAAGGYQAFRVDDPAVPGNFGLGDADSARLFSAGTTLGAAASAVDEFAWTDHAHTSWGRNPLDGDAWEETNAATFGAANDFSSTVTPDISWVVLNEIESNGDTANGDWVELYNTSDQAVDLSGAVLSDDDDTDAFVIPNGTTIAAGGYATFRVDDPAVLGSFGLGGKDAVRFYRAGSTPGASIPLDHEEWTSHAATTLGRTDSGLGGWAVTSASTYGAANQF